MKSLKVCLMCLMFSCLMCSCALFDTAVDAVTITGEVVDVSSQVDIIQDEIGVFSENEDAIADLDAIQQEILFALQGDISTTKLTTLYTRCAVIYCTLSEEISTRWDEIPTEQQVEIRALEVQLLVLDDDITAFLADSDNTDILSFGKNVLDTTYYCAKILAICSAI